MATNTNEGYRIGAVKNRSQVENPQNGHYVKRDAENGQFMEVKSTSEEPFKGVTKEDSQENTAEEDSSTN